VIEQPFIRAEMDREMAYKRLVDDANNINNQNNGGGGGGYDPHQPGAGGGGGYERDYPSLPNNGGATPAGMTSRRAPPPPPPPPANGGGATPMVGTVDLGAAQPDDEEEYNPFAPSFMTGKR
jgi:hypothetical protein